MIAGLVRYGESFSYVYAFFFCYPLRRSARVSGKERTVNLERKRKARKWNAQEHRLKALHESTESIYRRKRGVSRGGTPPQFYITQKSEPGPLSASASPGSISTWIGLPLLPKSVWSSTKANITSPAWMLASWNTRKGRLENEYGR